MAAATAKKGRRAVARTQKGRSSAKKQAFPFTSANFLLFGCGVILISVGYLVMPLGDVYGHLSITVAPLLVLTGIVVFIPLSLFYKKKKS